MTLIPFLYAYLFLAIYQGLSASTETLGGVAVLLFGSAIYYGLWRYLSPRLSPTVVPQHASGPAPVSKSEIRLLVLISTVAFLFRLPGLNRSLDYDELYTTYHFIEADTFWDTISTYLVFNNHIGYSILGRISQMVIGPADWAVRVPALLLGLAGVIFLWFFARQFFSSQLGLVAASILAISPLHVLWSKSARGYSALVLLPLVSSYFYLRILSRPTRRDAVLYTLFSALGVYFHLYAVWVILVQFLFLLYLLIQEGRKKFVGRFINQSAYHLLWPAFPAIGLLSLILYAPVFEQLLFSISHRGQSGVLNLSFPMEIAGSFAGGIALFPAMILLALGAVGAFTLLKTAARFTAYFLLLFTVPLLVMWLVMRPYDLYPRFFAYLLPYFALFLAAGLLALWRFSLNLDRTYLRITALVLLAGFVGSIVWSWSVDSWRIEATTDYRAAMHFLMEDAPQGTVMCAIGYGAEIIKHYQDMEFVFPEAIENINLLQEGTPIRCLYHDVFWNSPQHRDLAAFLVQNAQVTEFGDVVVFSFVR